jgi:hypothetical protein
MTARIDPRLRSLLAAESTAPVHAYVRLAPRSASSSSGAACAERVMQRVAKRVDVPAEHHYLELLDSVHVAAPARFLKELLAQPEVVAADAVPDVGESGLIAPHDARDVPASAIDRPVRRRARRS